MPQFVAIAQLLPSPARQPRVEPPVEMPRKMFEALKQAPFNRFAAF
jgi:hypothetical protein